MPGESTALVVRQGDMHLCGSHSGYLVSDGSHHFGNAQESRVSLKMKTQVVERQLSISCQVR